MDEKRENMEYQSVNILNVYIYTQTSRIYYKFNKQKII